MKRIRPRAGKEPQAKKKAAPRSKKKAGRKPRVEKRRTLVKRLKKAKEVLQPEVLKPGGPLKDRVREQFCQQVLVRPTATDAYHYIKPSLTRASAGVIACRLLGEIKIQRRIMELLKKSEDTAVMTVREALLIETERARGKLSDYVSADKDGVHTHIELNGETPNPHAVKKLTTRRLIHGRGEEREELEFTTIELHDGRRSSKVLGELLGWPEEIQRRLDVAQAEEEGASLIDLIKDAEGATRGLPPKREE